MSLLEQTNWDEVFKEAEVYLSSLIRIPTVNPPGNEKEACLFLSEIIRKEGIEPEIIESAPGRANLIARLKGTSEKPPVLLDAHLDVVPASEEGWKYPPFSGEMKEGYIWGRGAVDMKQTAIMNLIALLLLKRGGVKLDRDLIFVATADEEAGCTFGASFLVDNYPEKIRAEYALGELGGFSMEIGGKHFYPVLVAEKGVCWFKLRARGKPGHGSIPSPSSALVKLSEAIAKLGKNKLPFHLTPVVDAFIKRLAKELGFPKGTILSLVSKPSLSDFILDNLFPDPDFAQTFWAMLHNTANPTVISAGEKTNVIPSEAVVEVDGRVLPGQSAEQFIDEVKELIGEGYEIEVIKKLTPAQQNPDDRIISLFEKHLRKFEPKAIVLPNLIPGFTNGSFYSKLGIKYFGFSPLKLSPDEKFRDLFHGVNERIPVEGFRFGLKVFISLVEELVSGF